jgi:hypothetical protein
MEPFTSAEVQSEKDGQTRSPANVIIDAKVGFETVQRLYYLRHSFEAYDPLLLQFQVTLAFMVIKTLYSGRQTIPTSSGSHTIHTHASPQGPERTGEQELPGSDDISAFER